VPANSVDSRLFHVRGKLSYGILHAHRGTGCSDPDHSKRCDDADDRHDDDQFGHADTAVVTTAFSGS
jgi:hypothetical protein